MGIVFPKKLNTGSKVLGIVLLIGLSPILIIALLLYVLWGIVLYIAIWLTWKKGLVLFVYSNSPTWKDYIEREVFPRLKDRAVILNWSERKTWRSSLAVLAFRYFGGYRNFNPIGMIFRPFHRVKTYRFFDAFKDFKHGNPAKVEELKKEFLEVLEIRD